MEAEISYAVSSYSFGVKEMRKVKMDEIQVVTLENSTYSLQFLCGVGYKVVKKKKKRRKEEEEKKKEKETFQLFFISLI